jgi:L-gulonolactone oxidase
MSNVPSISDPTLAGVVATATHGTGIHFPSLSTHVIALDLLLADGSRVSCSRQERSDLFIASLCGLGSTGFILSVRLEVEPAYRLKEVQEMVDFEHGIKHFDELVSSAQHVRFWWFPASGLLCGSYANRTHEVSWVSIAALISLELTHVHVAQDASAQLAVARPAWTSCRPVFAVHR